MFVCVSVWKIITGKYHIIFNSVECSSYTMNIGAWWLTVLCKTIKGNTLLGTCA